ncbi:HNH endonuclease [Eggerthella lenta]|uniref:HNH endonuclease n=1 Tax=Eggerthella lenta TaxID=84112 RepID=UPI003DA55708
MRPHGLRSACSRLFCRNHNADFVDAHCTKHSIDFGKEFGEEFSGVIEVHHLEPLSLSKGEREIDPIKDLVPLCPNCHKMVHRKAGKPYTLEQIRALRRTSLD